MISSRIIQAAHDLRRIALSLVEEQIKQSPAISFGTHIKHGKSVEVIRFRTNKDGESRWMEVSLSSKSGKKCVPIARKVAMLRKALLELKKSDSSCCSGAPTELPGSPNPQGDVIFPEPAKPAQKFTYEEWCALVENNDKSITKGYRHGSRIFRSKSEVLIAQLLESLGLEYKYEPLMVINGKERWPDFAVYCPETNRFFLIEHLGMMDKTNYRIENAEKILDYETAGFRTDIDIIYSMEFGPGSFSIDAVYGKLLGLVLVQSRLGETYPQGLVG